MSSYIEKIAKNIWNENFKFAEKDKNGQIEFLKKKIKEEKFEHSILKEDYKILFKMFKEKCRLLDKIKYEEYINKNKKN